MLVMKKLAIKLRAWPPSQPINKGSCIDSKKLWREWRPSKLNTASPQQQNTKLWNISNKTAW